jgi:hypothetical protein
VPVLAVDLQRYASVLSLAIIGRTEPVRYEELVDSWLMPTHRRIKRRQLPQELHTPAKLTVAHVKAVRVALRTEPQVGLVWRAYAGHYFSPEQAIAFDALLRALPPEPQVRMVCLAAVIRAAMKCAAAPGHTAQPFQPTSSSLPHIASAWSKHPLAIVDSVLRETASRHALVAGSALVGDAQVVASRLREGDLAFVDPPYSSAQYSRYYHVLETVARGYCGDIDGAGRYPPIAERPSSVFSRRALASSALLDLLDVLAERRCSTILTFPQHAGSNGVVGHELVEHCRSRFEVDVRSVSTTTRSAHHAVGPLSWSYS